MKHRLGRPSVDNLSATAATARGASQNRQKEASINDGAFRLIPNLLGDTEVRKHLETWSMRAAPMNEDVDLEKSRVNSIGREAGGLLSVPPRIYREFADEYQKLAQTTTDEFQRALYLKMASTWEHAAIRFESGVERNGITAEHSPTEDDEETQGGER
jgi:hypothetical protein